MKRLGTVIQNQQGNTRKKKNEENKEKLLLNSLERGDFFSRENCFYLYTPSWS